MLESTEPIQLDTPMYELPFRSLPAGKPSILITGCSSGIGRATAIRLRASGWRVFATARKQADVDVLLSDGFESWLLDIADSASIDRTIARLQLEGGCSALFANAGFAIPGAIEDLTREAWREQFETNVFGTAELVGKLAKLMIAAKQGKIIINSSVLGYVALPLRGAYVASKFALEGVANTLRLELSGTGVHVCLLEPGPVLASFRINSLHNLNTYIDTGSSRFATAYTKMSERLHKTGPAVPFTVSAEIVADAVHKILGKKTLPTRLRITVPAKLNWWLNHMLPARVFDKLLNNSRP